MCATIMQALIRDDPVQLRAPPASEMPSSGPPDKVRSMPPARKPSQGSRSRARRKDTEDAPRRFGKLLHYDISGLFGQYNHAFDLVVDEPTILTGANGTGKSTILRTINAVGAGAWQELLTLPFKSLTLKFEKAPLVRVTQQKESLKVEHAGEEWRSSAGERRKVLVRGDPRQLALEGDYEVALMDAPWDLTPAQRRRLEIRPDQLQAYWSRSLAEGDEPTPDWIDQMSASFPVRFVTDQRLVLYGDDPRQRGPHERGEAVRHAVSEYARDLRRRISRELARYAAASQREDRAFPQLVVEAMSAGTDVDPEEVRHLIDIVGERREALQRVGLLESDIGTAPRFEPASLEQQNVSAVIKTFAETTLQKFEILEPFRRRLQLFVDFIDEHFVDKRAITTDEHGLIFELSDGSVVQPAELSSGEQQMLVLAYQLLFESSPGTLLLVDEPEISLHVGWQSSFVEDITEMARDRDLQFLLATHSPVLIGGREDLKRSLDRPARR
jgi:energy-coupling factor transporter ATP-binding protein EcfA2